MQGNNRIGHCDTFHLGRLCGPELRNGTGFFSGAGISLCLIRHGAQKRVSAIASAESREERAATVDVLVFGW
jgi:hypothetical protein